MIDYQQINMEQNAILKRYLPLLNCELHTVDDLQNWLRDTSRLQEAIAETLSGHYLDYQLDLNNEQKRNIFLYDQQVVRPLLDKLGGLLTTKMLSLDFLHELDPSQYGSYLASKRNARTLYAVENEQRLREEESLKADYLHLYSQPIVLWEGTATTVAEMDIWLRSADRDIRKRAWAAIQEARRPFQDEIESVFDSLLQVRHDIAIGAGFSNYRDYVFQSLEREYTPQELFILHESLQHYILPLKRHIEDEHRRALGCPDYRPWDTLGTPQNTSPVTSSPDPHILLDQIDAVLDAVDPSFAQIFRQVRERGSYDLAARPEKAAGQFCIPLPVSRTSFLYLNLTGGPQDPMFLLHEIGHCIHQTLCHPLPLTHHKQLPNETAELAALTMELLCFDCLDIVYPQQSKKAKRDHLINILYLLTSGGMIDSFQHWLYENPQHTPEERAARFQTLTYAYNGILDMDGYHEEMANQWRYLRHLFQFPFYYIEYVIAQVGALQIWYNYRQDPAGTLQRFKYALSLGRTCSVREVYEAAGVRFSFEPEAMRKIAELLEEELKV
ncbi:M3 family oligoendopeptidase [Tumebacillus lipolyticus]|uniref:M3 family oligoendopeptidase n=1 Tax=Tumebacillus lipolyticus TaxID=1280370 RepID=A0ABW4ZYW3_9BACL